MQSRQAFIIALLIGVYLVPNVEPGWDLEYDFPCGAYIHNAWDRCANQTNAQYSELAKSADNATILCDGYIVKFKCFLEEICSRCQPEDIEMEEAAYRRVLSKELESPACTDKFNYEGSYCTYLNKTERETTAATTSTLAVITTESATTMNRTKKSIIQASADMPKPLFRLSVVLGIVIAFMACVACYVIAKRYCFKRNSAEESAADVKGNILIDL